MTAKNSLLAQHLHPLIPIPSGMDPDLRNMRRFSAFLFDVYGTLMISGAGEIGFSEYPREPVNGLNGLLRRYGIDQPPDRLAGRLQGKIEKAHAASRRQGIDNPEVDIVQIWQQVLGFDFTPEVEDFALEYELMVNPVYPMPGAEALFLACRDRSVPMGIISNAQFYTVLLLQHIFGSTLEGQGFETRLLFFSWQEGHAKPSPVMFKRAKMALADMGIPAGSVLYIGNDMRKDILPARAVGFRTALFAGDRRSLRQRESADSCKGVSPDLIVTDLRQLIVGTGDR
jgi:putative hydrolase of the HAD superfamily